MFGRTRYYTIHEPENAETGSEEAVFVREGFSYAAWVFGPFWFFWHKLWWEATGFMAIDLLFIAAALGWPEQMALVGAFG
ncbi:MAG: DUF2628 domain-containing protein, partial [Alphaproteobacteria bacterium]|nr:DUF2628 domain-containing protein [Alphaproteobacteria bacterium]